MRWAHWKEFGISLATKSDYSSLIGSGTCVGWSCGFQLPVHIFFYVMSAFATKLDLDLLHESIE